VQPQKYRKLEIIGQGPSATVYAAEHVDLGAAVAIKELHQDLRQNVKRRDRFFKEADLWAALSHDHLVAVRDVDRSRGWIVMDRMQGSLAAEMAAGDAQPFDATRVRDVLRQCLQFLDYLHTDRRTLHGNVKPGNILFDSRQRVRLNDGHGIRIDRPGELPRPTGSYKYLAPEMLAQSFGDVGPGTDLYCLGFVMLELLLGTRFNTLFKGAGEDALDPEMGWLRWHSSPGESAPLTSDVADGVPHDLGVVIDSLLCKDLVQRYGRAADALEDLQPHSEPQHEPAGPVVVPQPMSPTSAAPDPAAPDPAAMAPPSDVAESSPTPSSAASPAPMPSPATPRPNTPVVLRVASGPRAGEMVGLDGDQVVVGFGPACQLGFDPEQYPAVVGRQWLIRREAAGWTLHRRSGGPSILNGELVSQEALIRSGDLVRLSARGPDFQFILQNPNEESLASIAARFAEADPTATPSGMAASVVPASAAPQPQGSVPPEAAAPAPPSAAPAPPTPTATSNTSSAVPPSSAAPAPVAETAPSAAAAAPSPPGIVADKGLAPPTSSWRKLFDTSSWDKKTTNWIIIAAAVIVLALVVLFVPTGGDNTTDEPPGDPAATQTGNAGPPANPE